MNVTKFVIIDTPLAGLRVIQRVPLADSRGYFCRFFCADELYAAGFCKPIAQVNHTFTHKVGAVRGLHLQ